jgi:drug/metabolite transporter (DMT)-like permease
MWALLPGLSAADSKQMQNAEMLYRASLILLTASLVSVGQAMFKYVGLMLADGHPVVSFKVLGVAVLSFAISGCGSLVYIGLLRTMSLSAAYPFMALSFAMVPALSVLLYGDRLNGTYFIGLGFIIAGIVIITR